MSGYNRKDSWAFKYLERNSDLNMMCQISLDKGDEMEDHTGQVYWGRNPAYTVDGKKVQPGIPYVRDRSCQRGRASRKAHRM